MMKMVDFNMNFKDGYCVVDIEVDESNHIKAQVKLTGVALLDAKRAVELAEQAYMSFRAYEVNDVDLEAFITERGCISAVQASGNDEGVLLARETDEQCGNCLYCRLKKEVGGTPIPEGVSLT